MDRIEPVEDSNAHPESHRAQESSPETSTLRPPIRPRALSNRTRRPSIRISRLSSISSLDTAGAQQQQQQEAGPEQRRQQQQPPSTGQRTPGGSDAHHDDHDAFQGGRRRSNSEPRPGRFSSPPPELLTRSVTPMRLMPLSEESSLQSPVAGTPPVVRDFLQHAPENLMPPPDAAATPAPSRNVLRRTSQAALNRFSRNRASTITGVPPPDPAQNDQRANEYGPHVVDFLDVIDPEVSALSTLTNVQNSLFIPNLGNFVNRMPTYVLTRSPESSEDEEQGPTADEAEPAEGADLQQRPTLEQLRPFSSMSQVVTGPRFAVLPEGHELEGWTKEDFSELNDHVRHMLHSRRSKFKRSMKGFRQYIRNPLGFLVTLYATLITLFGLAWVLFLIGWINVGGKQAKVINIIDNILVGLFAIMGDGLAPFRAVDTYHMIFIAHYTHLTWKIRQQRRLPDLKNKNDLPERCEKDVDVEVGGTPKEDEYEFSVLDKRQQLRLMHHQTKFSKSHTFYKPHETVTHHAFSLRFLVAIVVILDCHSLLQIALGVCTWSLEPPKYRPFALTTVILCCSITCNITGGVLIMIGDRLTRKKDVVERLFRQQLTEEAIEKMEKKKVEERRSTQIERLTPDDKSPTSDEKAPASYEKT